MIRHIILWKIDPDYSSKESEVIRQEIKKQILQLKSKIKEIVSLEVHFHSPEAGQNAYDIILDSTFKSITDLNAYRVHEEHLKVVNYLKAIKLSRAAIDYEI